MSEPSSLPIEKSYSPASQRTNGKTDYSGFSPFSGIDAEYIANRLGKAARSGTGWNALCPAHDDHNPSLSISDAEDGRILVHCHANCSQTDVIRELTIRNLWPQWGNSNQRPPATEGVNIDELRCKARQKYPGGKKDADAASDNWQTSPKNWAEAVARYSYTDEHGKVIFQKGRWERIKAEGRREKTFRLRHASGRHWVPGLGQRAVPYRLHKIVTAETIYVVEGEKDVATLERWGLMATTSHASSTWDERWSPLFKGKTVIILPDNDATGRKYAAMVGQSVKPYAKACKTVNLPVPEKGDVTDWVEAGGTAAGLEKLVTATPWDRPSVCVGAPKRDAVVKACIRAFRQRNQSEPVLFTRGHSMVYVAEDKKGRAGIVEVEKSYLLGELERSADFYKVTKKGRADAWPAPALAEAILSRPQAEWGFPGLDGVVTGPVLRKDWSLVIEPGYDSGLCLYYAPQGGLQMPPIPEKPTPEQCHDAAAVIDDVIGEFPWVGPADRANYMALLLTPVVRHVVGSVPIALIDAPKKGNGKTLLAEILARVHEGKPPSLWTPPTADNWEKIITTVLLSGQPITVFDNLETTLSSPVLSKVVTSDEHADRQFHTQKRLVMRNSTLFVVTGNNIKLAGDIGRRCYQIRLDAKSSRPWERKKFQHPYLKSYVLQRRSEILTAILTMARGWAAAGKPRMRTEELGGGFEGWSRTVGRILAYAGVEGFLGNQERLYADSDVPEGQWADFLMALRRRYPNGFKIGSLVSDLQSDGFPRDALPDDPEFSPRRGDYDNRKIAGIFLRKLHTRFGSRGLFLGKKDKAGAAALWHVGAESGAR